MPSPRWPANSTPPVRPPRVCVVVPARNERTTILAALEAIRRQQGIALDRVEVVVLANNCDDDSAALARAFGRRHPELALDVIEQTFPPDSADIGTVRRALMDEAASRLPPGGIIASTDSDTVVDRAWLAATLREFAAGADLVGGRIFTEPPTPYPGGRALRRLYLADTAYRLLLAEAEAIIDPDPFDPWPRHFQHFGASLAITREAYLAVGGLPRVPNLEDMALYDELRRADAAIRHSPAVRVRTSARTTGRAGLGLSTQLDEWQALTASGQPWIVESAAFALARARVRRRLRECWSRERALAGEIAFGRFYEAEIAGFAPDLPRCEPVADAITALRAALVALRRERPGGVTPAPTDRAGRFRPAGP